MTPALNRAILLACLAATPALAEETVTVDNFKRAETHYYMALQGEAGCFARLCQARGPVPVEEQTIIRLNRDTPYSQGVFDLTTPLTVTMPDPGDRFQSIIVINEDHYIKKVSYGAATFTLTQEEMGSRYVYLGVRTFMNPEDPEDLAAGHALQDAIVISQDSPGELVLPDWNQQQRSDLHDALLLANNFLPDTRNAFGNIDDVDPVRHLIVTSSGWGGNRQEDAFYFMASPPVADGETAYTLTVPPAPVDGFWSLTVYNSNGFYEAPETAISVNNVTAKTAEDGSVTIHFGGDPAADNYLRIMPGWNYAVRLYRPRTEILHGTWAFPELQPVN